MARKIKVKRDELEELNWQQLPKDGGQIVSVAYAVDWVRGILYRQSYDRSDRTATYTAARLYMRATDEELLFEPQNGLLPRHNQWQDVEVVN